MKAYQKIIFVCNSGTLRGPMAEAIMKEYHLNRNITIESRGLVVLFPEPMNQKAEAVLISNGIPVKDLMSRQLLEEDIEETTLLIVMEETQRWKLLKEYPSAREEQVQVLTQMVGDELEIIDPYGNILPHYGICYETLNRSIKKLVEKINTEETEDESEDDPCQYSGKIGQ